MKHKLNRFKSFIKNNKKGTTYIIILIIYTLIMGSIIFFAGKDKDGCSSGSLSNLMNQETVQSTSEAVTE